MLRLLLIASIVCGVFGSYNGPFLLWGRDELSKIDNSALQNIDDAVLRSIYTESASIILFVKNASTRLSYQNFPSFKEVISSNPWTYLPQHWLSSDPIDYNVNAEVKLLPIIYSGVFFFARKSDIIGVGSWLLIKHY